MPAGPPDRVAASVGRPLADVFAELLVTPRDSPIVVAASAEFRALFASDVVPRAAELVFPAVRELLDRLADAGRPLAVVTSKSPAGAAEFLAAARLDQYFPVTVGYVPEVPGKPAPHQALAAARALGVDPAECVVVGDSTDDMKMADAAGIPGIGVGYGVATLAELRAAGAQHIAGTPEELFELLLPELSLSSATVPSLPEVST
ncbi:HAD family hydrolase [Catenulispora yoronensis]